MNLYEFDADYGIPLLCGVDEAGRGPLAGPVYAAAVILDPEKIIPGINDSKKLSPKKRDQLYEPIIEQAAAYSIAWASVEEIDTLNILNATFLAMKRAVAGLKIEPELVLIDGDKNPDVGTASRCIIKGDQKSACIAAASILAKVARDRCMTDMDNIYPEYGFANHKGYGTPEHISALLKHGSCEIHRKAFLRKLEQKNPGMSKGKAGEEAAARLLISKGYEILSRNYSYGKGEIDIVARTGDVLVFAEVKLRSSDSYGQPVEAVTQSKRRKIVFTAAKYISETKNKNQPRFDIIEVYPHQGKYYLKHHEHAFTADGINIFI